MRNTQILSVLILIFCHSVHATITKKCRAVDKCLEALSSGKRCPLLPVPPRSLNTTPLPAEGFLLEYIRPGVHSYTDLVYGALIIFKSRRLTLVDFPNSASSFTPSGDYLLNTAISRVLDGAVPKRADMIYSHRHTDHIGQAGVVKQYLTDAFPDVKIFVWATAGVRDFIKERGLTRIPPPTVIVGEAGRTVNVEPGLELKVFIVGGHTFDDLAAHILPSRQGKGILHYVDVVTPGQPPFIDFGLSVNLFQARKAQRELLKLDWDILSAGHGRLGSKFDIRRNIRYTESVIAAALEAAAEVPPELFGRIARKLADPDAAQFGNAIWGTLVRIDAAVDLCVKKTIERWGCRLTGVDLLAPSHCKEALLITTIET